MIVDGFVGFDFIIKDFGFVFEVFVFFVSDFGDSFLFGQVVVKDVDMFGRFDGVGYWVDYVLFFFQFFNSIQVFCNGFFGYGYVVVVQVFFF